VAATAAPPVQTSLSALNPSISVITNFLGRADNQQIFLEGERIDNTMNLREAEIDFRAPIDPYADGVLMLAVESAVPGVFEAGVEEGYVNLKKLPFVEMPLGLKFQVGRFRPALGKFNSLHTHDLPTTMRSLPTQEFLGDEGFISQGFSNDFFIPTPWDENQALNARLQVLTSGNIAIDPISETRISYLGNLRWFKTTGAHNTELGWSTYWHRSKDATPEVAVNVMDFLYKWKPFRQGEWKSFLLGGELFFSNRNPADVHPWGSSVFTQWQFDRRKYAGVRWDYTTTVDDPTILRRSITPYLSYYFSEFLRFRINYEQLWSGIASENGRKSLYLEFNWIFGSHPPEPFWVNK